MSQDQSSSRLALSTRGKLTENVKENCSVPYSVIHASKGSINDEFDCELCLDWALIPFRSTHYPTEEYTYVLGCQKNFLDVQAGKQI